MVWRHNQDFAKWITTTRDPMTGTTVPADRWFSDQIPAEYLFGGTPSNPNDRLFTSASPLWTADTAPYGSIGITSFNIDFGSSFAFAQTLVNVAPAVAARNRPWAITEWNPYLKADASIPDPPDLQQRYNSEVALIKVYRPRLVIPLAWGSTAFPVENTGFETALKSLVNEIKDGLPSYPLLAVDTPPPSSTLSQPFTLSGWALDGGIVRGPGWGTGVDVIHVDAIRNPGPGAEPPIDLGTIPYGLARPDIAAIYSDAQFTNTGFAITVTRLPVGVYDFVISARSTVTGTFNMSQTRRVTITRPPGIPAEPFGVVDTPAQNATVAGGVGVTGWALDDHGIAGVDIYRSSVSGEFAPDGQIFVGTATRVRGARPDLEVAYAALAENDRAGWGLMILSNMFPGGGNGMFTLTIIARDLDGLKTTLGTRTINVQNATSVQPFGTIDTPAQGETISGSSYLNFGWALTPQTAMIPVDGSTITVYIDGVPVGKPAYNVYRSDIAGLFPGLNNTNGAIGIYVIDTTTLANGVHTIAWVVFDDAGHGTGIGSRFFTVQN
jgi:hypothetical protein